MNKIVILVGLFLTLTLKVNAEELGVTIPAPPVVVAESDCDRECQPDKVMKTFIEGKVANVSCLQACQQRKVWEKLATSIADVADSLKDNSYKEMLIPIGIKMDELKTKVDLLEKKVDNLKSAEKPAPLVK